MVVLFKKNEMGMRLFCCLQLYNFFSTLLARAPTTAGPLSATDPGPPPDSDDPEGEKGFLPVEPGYKGPRVDLPLTREGLDILLAAFRRKKVRILINNLLREIE